MRAIYAGSFDILTFGHIDIIKQTIKMFGNCSIVVAVNPNKKALFSEFERYQMIWEWVKENDPNGKMDCLIHNGLTVDAYPYYTNSSVLIRGVRNVTDMISELALADVNEELSGIKTIFIPTCNEYRNYSSSLVKELWKNGKDVSKYCPPYVVEKLKEKQDGK